MFRKLISAIVLTSAFAAAQTGIRLEHVTYPFPEKQFEFESQQQSLEMCYMDLSSVDTVSEKAPVLLLHGKNFSGSYFEETARKLSESGYRVIIPDQIGFGKSSKPAHYQYSFQQLAMNTKALLENAGIKGNVHVLGHSMGGMLATRFALMYPDQTLSLTLLNPIGLEDWKAKGVPYQSIDRWYASELGKTAAKIRAYQLDAYYDNQWKAAYDPWVEQLASFTESPDYPRMAWNQALTYDMIFTQPVVDEFPRLKMPVLLIIGQRDRTALGKGSVSAELRAQLGDYPALGRAAKAAIPHAELVELDGIGHLPHIESFERFFTPYVGFLDQSNP
ncbi:MAG: alpha/beta fold hydrolase [Verrucomicrobiales bacterium]|nr:alpha/beta hydrolase [Verrucomicrobiota bacterium JB025]